MPNKITSVLFEHVCGNHTKSKIKKETNVQLKETSKFARVCGNLKSAPKLKHKNLRAKTETQKFARQNRNTKI